MNRLLELQGSQPADADGLPAQAAAGARYVGGLRKARIGARTLVLHGGADTVVDPRNGKLLAGRIPGARLVIFPELGHLLFWEDPDGFADAVAAFLLARPSRSFRCSWFSEVGFVAGSAELLPGDAPAWCLNYAAG